MRNLLTPNHAFSPWFQDIDEALDQVLTNQKMAEKQKIDFSPACEVSENGTHYVMSFDLPGVPKEDIKIEVLGKELTVSGERKRSMGGERGTFHVKERLYGSFKRVFTLPTPIVGGKVEARFKDGGALISDNQQCSRIFFL